MTVNEINEFLIKINEIQEKMNVTLFQKGNMALILRIVLWTSFVGLLFYQYINQKLSVGNSLFLAILSWLMLSFVTLLIFSYFTKPKEMEKVQIVPIEFAFYFKSKREVKNEVPKLLSEINSKIGKNNPHFTDLETAKRFLQAEKPKREYFEEQERIRKEENTKIAEEKQKENSRILEKIEKAVKGEVFRTIHKKDFPVSINDKDVMVIIGISIQKTELYKKKIKEKPVSENFLLKYSEKDLTPLLQNNPVVEEYIDNTVKKVNEVLKNE